MGDTEPAAHRVGGDARHANWLAAALTATGLLAVVSVMPVRASTFITTHWLFTYGDGLRRRSLMGTLLDRAVGDRPVTREGVALVGLVTVVVLLGVVVWLARLAWRRNPGFATAVLAVLLVVSPVTLRYASFEIGRFDTVGATLVVLSLILLLRDLGWVGVVVIGLLGGVGVAVHENYLVISLPLLLAAYLVGEVSRSDAACGAAGTDRRWVARAVAVVVMVLPAVAVLGWTLGGGIPEERVGPLTEELTGRAGFEPEFASEGAVLVHARSVGDNIRYTWERVAGRGPGVVVAGALVALPTVLVSGWSLVRDARRVERRRRWPAPLLVVSALAPLSLAVIGEDWGRWMALAATNLALLALWIRARWDGSTSDTDARVTPITLDAGAPDGPQSRWGRWALLLVLMSALLPPPRFSGEPSGLRPAWEALRVAVNLLTG